MRLAKNGCGENWVALVVVDEIVRRQIMIMVMGSVDGGGILQWTRPSCAASSFIIVIGLADLGRSLRVLRWQLVIGTS